MTSLPMTPTIAAAFVIVISVGAVAALVVPMLARRKIDARRRKAFRVIDGALLPRPYSNAWYSPKQYRGRKWERF